MANGDCPVGARNSEAIKALGRTCDRHEADIKALEARAETLHNAIEGVNSEMKVGRALDWKQMVLVIVLIALSSGGGSVIAQALKIVE